MNLAAFEESTPVSLSTVFVSQCFDHAFTALVSALFIASAMSVFALPTGWSWSDLSPTFWLGFLLTLLFTSLVCRFFFLAFLGRTLGNLLTGTRPSRKLNASKLILGQFLESLQLVVPALWALELFSRRIWSSRKLRPGFGIPYEMSFNAP